jgi:hypothetical protein
MSTRRKFVVSFELNDNDPTGDKRDVISIVEILTREFSYDSYFIDHINIQEKVEEDDPEQRPN